MREAPAGDARPNAFISYAREQKDFVARLAEALHHHGKSTWVDWKDIRPTADWRAKVQAGIEQATAFIFVLSPDSLQSEICAEEKVHAVECNKRIIPIVRVDVDPDAVVPELVAPNWIFVRDEDDFAAAVRTLVEALDTDLEWLDTHARLLVRATEWKANRSHRSFLLRGRDLAAAERWFQDSSRHRERPTALHEQYIRHSRRATTRRRRFVTGVTTLAVAGAAVLSVAGWGQRETARSRSKAAQAIAEVARDPWAALERAIEAAETADTPEATAALRLSLGAPRERLILREPAGGTIHSAQFGDDGRHVVTTAYDGTVRTWRLDTGTSEITANVRSGPPGTFGRAIDASPDGMLEVLALGGGVVRGGEEEALRRAAPGGGVVRVVDARSKMPRTERPALLERTNLGEGIEGLAPSVDFSPDGRHFLAVGYDGTARVWALGFVTLGEADVLSVAISPDGSRCATLNDQWMAAAWSCGDGAEIHRWRLDVPGSRDERLQPGDVRLSFSADGTALFVSVGSGAIPATTSSWDPATGRKLAEVAAQGRSPASFNRDGTLVLLDGSSNSARIAEVATRQPKVQLTGIPKGVGVGVFSRDGTRLVTSNREEDVVRVWDARTGAGLRPPIGPFASPVEDVDISPDGSLIATTSGPSPQLWDAAREAEPMELRGHSDVVYGLRFNPTGAFVVTAGGDGTARVWETRTGREVLVRRGDNGALLQAAMSADRLITVGLDRTAFSFACESCQTGAGLLRAARAAAASRPR